MYDANYRVLICRECQYAIQKSALQSHLLRHKIYRNERQRLLSSIAHLDLCEPHEVSLPTPTSPAIEHLPVLSGYRCLVEGCDNLCSSTKRMKQHQSKEHGFSESHVLASLTLSIQLQTFFRGTKLRYFEVARSATLHTATKISIANVHRHHETDQFFAQEINEQMHEAGARTSPSLPEHFPDSSSTLLNPLAVSVNLGTLTYFHHFTTITCLTLPGTNSTIPIGSLWLEQVVPQALQHRWLMCGLLAISSYHLAALANDRTLEEVHRRRSVSYSLEFSATWEQQVSSESRESAFEWAAPVKTAAGLIQCILHCADCMFKERDLDQLFTSKPSAQLQLQSLLASVRNFVVADLDFSLFSLEGSDNSDDPFRLATRTLKMIPSNGALSAPLNRLALLPSRIADALGRPDHLPDVLATLNAIAILVNCCATGFLFQDAEVSFLAMVSWLIKVPDQFQILMYQGSPAALVVVAHWAAYLVKHAEDCGCWFLRNYAYAMIRCIREQVAGNEKVMSLLDVLEQR